MQKYKLSTYVIIAFFTLFSESALSIVNSYINTKVSPADNFFKHATTGRPIITSIFEDSQYALEQKISSCIQSNEKADNIVGNMYQSLINEQSYQKILEQAGTIFAEIDGIDINDKHGIVAEIARLNKLGAFGGMDIMVAYPNATSALAVYIVQGDSVIDFNGLSRFVPNTLFNPTDKANVERVKSLNGEFIKLNDVKNTGVDGFIKVQLSDLTKENPDFWTTYFTAHRIFGKVNEVYIKPKPANTSSGIDLIYGNKPYSVSEWKTYLKFAYLNAFVDILEQQNMMHNRDKQNQKRVEHILQRRISGELGRLCFVKEMQNQGEVLKIADNILKVYNSSIISASYIDVNKKTPKQWISDDTKKDMLEKLSFLRVEIGYEQLVAVAGYSALQITPNDPLGNAMKLIEFEYQHRIDQINTRTGHSAYWGMSITDPSPVYLTNENIVVIPLGALMEPLFIRGNDAFNYAVFGFFFGHEVGHAFDIGMVNDSFYVWKRGDDKKKFADKINKLEQQYGNYHKRSKITISEDVADNLGFAMASIAYQIFLNQSPNGQIPKKEEGKQDVPDMSDIRAFYYDFAQLFTSYYNISPDDPHSSGEYRVNGVLKNQDKFYDIFHVGPKDGMYLVPAEDVDCGKKCRVKFW